MDPLSITASVVTLIGATKATGKGLQRLWELPNAPEHLSALKNELNDVLFLLEFVRSACGEDKVGSFSPDCDLVSPAIQQSMVVVQQIQSLIDTNLTQSSSNQEIVRYRGFLKRQRLQQMHANLRDARLKLSTALISVIFSQQQAAFIRLDLAIQSGFLAIAETQSVDSSRMIIASGSTYQPIQQVAHISMKSNAASSPVNKSTVVFSVPTRTNHCPAFCTCQCHIRNFGNTPYWLQSVFGNVFYQCTGTLLLHKGPCNLSKCRATTGSAKLEYYFPEWLIACVLRFSASWRTGVGPSVSWALRVPSYIPQASYGILSIVARAESAEQLEHYLDTQRIPAWAEFSYGQSLLDVSTTKGPETIASLVLTFAKKAISCKRWDMADLLLRRGADIQFRSLADPMTTAQYAWVSILRGMPEQAIPHSFLSTLEDSGALDELHFNVAHRIITGLLDLDLEQQLDLNPEIVSGRDFFCQTPLFWSVTRDHADYIIPLVKRGADVNACDKLGYTPLHYAARNITTTSTSALISCGANVNVLAGIPGLKRSPLNEAVRQGSIENVRLLLENGANPDAGDYAPLIRAAAVGRRDILHALCESGANIDKQSVEGYSAIMMAVQCNHPDSVQELCDTGVQLNIKTKDGLSVIDLAASAGGPTVMNILTEALPRGLQIEHKDLTHYWKIFDSYRNTRYVGIRAPIEEERASLQRLLESVCRLDDYGSNNTGGETRAQGVGGYDDETSDDDEFLDASEGS